MEPRSHIVVVEDEATQRQLLVDYLTRQNFRVTGVDGGIALRKLFERELPALVLLDVGLPDEDGFTITPDGYASALRESVSSWSLSPPTQWTVSSGWKSVQTTISPSHLSPANYWHA